MLNDKDDIFYDARLVATARLHLPNIMAGHSSPIFFEIMCEIVERNVYRGYKAPNGKDVRLSGIKDFLYNFHYGLGIKGIHEFVGACIDLKTRKNDKDPNLARFLEWLEKEDPNSFNYHPYYWDYKRLLNQVLSMKGSIEKRRLYMKMVARMYVTQPQILSQIGYKKKYANVPTAYYKEGYAERATSLSKIKLGPRTPDKDIEALARDIHSRLSPYQNRLLIAKLLEVYKVNDAVKKHLARGTSPDDDSAI